MYWQAKAFEEIETANSIENALGSIEELNKHD
jgi:hypothetical protein